jgi:hypothetical protein
MLKTESAESNLLTLVKPWSTWVLTSKTSPTTPNDPLDQVNTHLWSTLGQRAPSCRVVVVGACGGRGRRRSSCSRSRRVAPCSRRPERRGSRGLLRRCSFLPPDRGDRRRRQREVAGGEICLTSPATPPVVRRHAQLARSPARRRGGRGCSPCTGTEVGDAWARGRREGGRGVTVEKMERGEERERG